MDKAQPDKAKQVKMVLLLVKAEMVLMPVLLAGIMYYVADLRLSLCLIVAGGTSLVIMIVYGIMYRYYKKSGMLENPDAKHTSEISQEL